MNQNSDYDTYSPTRQNTPRGQGPRRRGKRRFRPNKEGMLALALLVLIVAVVITLLVLTIKAIVNTAGRAETSETTAPAETTAPVVTPVATWHDGYLQESVSTDKTAEGTLVLVNFENKYSFTEKIASKLSGLYGINGHGTVFVLNRSDMELRREVVTPLTTMLTDLIAAADGTLGTVKTADRVMISSAYRSTKYQEDLYAKASETNYVAAPGFSEHHTGFAVDLKVYTAAGKTVDFRDNERKWLEENCVKYGFIVRYDGAKFELTGILDESWHYRYVGVPHATYMTEHDICMEEYITLLREKHNYLKDEPLTFTTADTDYLVYYYPASADSTTFVPVPPKSVGTYEISGNNVDGFIVTVAKSK